MLTGQFMIEELSEEKQAHLIESVGTALKNDEGWLRDTVLEYIEGFDWADYQLWLEEHE